MSTRKRARQSQRQDSVVFVAGRRGSGKSSFLKQYARGFPRVIVWDVNDEYGAALGAVPAYTPSTFVEKVFSGAPVVVYVPKSDSHFQFFCRAVWSQRDCLVLVDELADVTTVAKAQQWWGLIIRRGRHRGIKVAAGAQRPAEVDKTLIANATRLVSFHLGYERDRQLIGELIVVDPRALAALRPLHFYDADLVTLQVEPGQIVFA